MQQRREYAKQQMIESYDSSMEPTMIAEVILKDY